MISSYGLDMSWFILFIKDHNNTLKTCITEYDEVI